MALIKCEECGKEISDKASSCPNCGCPMNQISKHDDIIPHSNKKKMTIIIGGIIICVFVVIIAILLLGKSTKNNIEETIEQEVTTEQTTEQEAVPTSPIEGIWVREKDDSMFSGMAIRITNEDGLLKGEVISSPANLFPEGTIKWSDFQENSDKEYKYSDSAVTYATGQITKTSANAIMKLNDTSDKIIISIVDSYTQTWVKVTEADMQSVIDSNVIPLVDIESNEDTQLYEDDIVSIKFKRFIGSEKGAIIICEVENKTDVLLNVYSSSLSINGSGLGEIIGSFDIAPNSTDKVAFESNTKIEQIELSELSGSITIYDESKMAIKDLAYDTTFSKVNITGKEKTTEAESDKKETKNEAEISNVQEVTKESLDMEANTEDVNATETQTTSFAVAGEQLVCDQLGITATFKGVDDPAGNLEKNYIAVKFLITNNTGKDIIILGKEFSINGCMITPIFAAEITNGNSAIAKATIKKDKLTEYGITSINTISSKIWIKDVGTTDLFSFTVQ